MKGLPQDDNKTSRRHQARHQSFGVKIVKTPYSFRHISFLAHFHFSEGLQFNAANKQPLAHQFFLVCLD